MKHKALQALRPEAEWVLRGDELEWLDTKQVKEERKQTVNTKQVNKERKQQKNIA